MRIRFALVLFLTFTTGLHAATISYNAFVNCNNNCVTVSLSWQNLFSPPSFVDVEDNLGNILFVLNTPFPGQTTGSIQPNPQTIFNLPPSTISIITNAQANVFAPAQQGHPPTTGTFANLVLDDSEHNPIATLRFVAEPQVPEPAAWTLAGAGLAFLLIRARIRRRNSQT
jgi:hypothetical protein